MEIIEALPIAGCIHRFRATIRWGERAMAGVPLCNCRLGHSNKREALDCSKARAAMPKDSNHKIIEPEED